MKLPSPAAFLLFVERTQPDVLLLRALRPASDHHRCYKSASHASSFQMVPIARSSTLRAVP